MATPIQIITNSADTTGSSVEFRINASHPRIIAEQPQLGLISASGNNTIVFTLKWKAPNGTFYTTGDDIFPTLGLWVVPYINDVVFRLDWIDNTSTINAYVYGGVLA